MYVDESGDPGSLASGSPTNLYILTGLVVHELDWQKSLDHLIAFRKRMRNSYGLRLREELHASKLITKPGALMRLERYQRLALIRHHADTLAALSNALSVINVVVRKQDKPDNFDIFETAWQTLIQLFENTIQVGNFPGNSNEYDKGMIFPDNTDNRKLIKLLRKMRKNNPVASKIPFRTGYRNLTIGMVIEDPSFRDSNFSYFIQAADTAAYLLYQHLSPNRYMRKRGGSKYFLRLQPVLCKQAESNDPLGIVYR